MYADLPIFVAWWTTDIMSVKCAICIVLAVEQEKPLANRTIYEIVKWGRNEEMWVVSGANGDVIEIVVLEFVLLWRGSL